MKIIVLGLTILIFFGGCSTYSKIDLITEFRYKDKHYDTYFLKANSTYCITSSSPLMNRYQKNFSSMISKEWSKYSKLQSNCNTADYIIKLYPIVHYMLPRHDERSYWINRSREVKLTIFDNTNSVIMDYSIGQLRNIDNEEDSLFYSNFVQSHLNTQRIFGVNP